jgi:hypothetical protein
MRTLEDESLKRLNLEGYIPSKVVVGYRKMVDWEVDEDDEGFSRLTMKRRNRNR